jgi:hypothetical protein
MVGLALWVLLHKQPESPTQSTPVDVQNEELPAAPVSPVRHARSPGASVPNGSRQSEPRAERAQGARTSPAAPLPSTPPPQNTAVPSETRLKQMEQARENALNRWRTPIEFYGKVVDENSNVVAGAQADFDCNDTSTEGTSHYHTQSDANGLFSIKNIQGMLLGVKVNKEGYYAYLPNGESFFYAGRNQNFVPDSEHPVVFRLQKKGKAEPLIVWDKTFQISISGKPLGLDFRSGRTVSPTAATLVLSFVSEPLDRTRAQLYDWDLEVIAPNGGLLLSTNQFDFVAPGSGYAASDKINMPASLADAWQGRINRAYFVQLPDGSFGRFVLDLMSHHGSLRIQSFLNPSGSRNLEFDPNNVISGNP